MRGKTALICAGKLIKLYDDCKLLVAGAGHTPKNKKKKGRGLL